MAVWICFVDTGFRYGNLITSCGLAAVPDGIVLDLLRCSWGFGCGWDIALSLDMKVLLQQQMFNGHCIRVHTNYA